MTNPVANITNFYKFQQGRAPLTKRELRELFAASVGYCGALRDAGFKTGDGRLNDASNAQMEIVRYAREALGLGLEAWWLTENAK